MVAAAGLACPASVAVRGLAMLSWLRRSARTPKAISARPPRIVITGIVVAGSLTVQDPSGTHEWQA